MRHDNHEPEVEPIISDAAARFTVVLFLALFTIGAALLIWRGLSSVPEGFHWIDPVMLNLRASIPCRPQCKATFEHRDSVTSLTPPARIGKNILPQVRR